MSSSGVVPTHTIVIFIVVIVIVTTIFMTTGGPGITAILADETEPRPRRLVVGVDLLHRDRIEHPALCVLDFDRHAGGPVGGHWNCCIDGGRSRSRSAGRSLSVIGIGVRIGTGPEQLAQVKMFGLGIPLLLIDSSSSSSSSGLLQLLFRSGGSAGSRPSSSGAAIACIGALIIIIISAHDDVDGPPPSLFRLAHDAPRALMPTPHDDDQFANVRVGRALAGSSSARGCGGAAVAITAAALVPIPSVGMVCGVERDAVAVLIFVVRLLQGRVLPLMGRSGLEWRLMSRIIMSMRRRRRHLGGHRRRRGLLCIGLLLFARVIRHDGHLAVPVLDSPQYDEHELGVSCLWRVNLFLLRFWGKEKKKKLLQKT